MSTPEAGLEMGGSVGYDIGALRVKHQACLESIAEHFMDFFKAADYARENGKVRITSVRSQEDLVNILQGPGFYIIATDLPAGSNVCTLTIKQRLPVVYRGHSSNVRERIESHLFYDSYRAKDSGRRFTVCLKLDGKNINIDRPPLNRKEWIVVTHSMPKSNVMIRVAAEAAFDKVFRRPVGSEK